MSLLISAGNFHPGEASLSGQSTVPPTPTSIPPNEREGGGSGEDEVAEGKEQRKKRENGVKTQKED